MPIYSFLCKKCKSQFDIIIDALSAGEKPQCEKCGSYDISRIFSGFSVGSSSGNHGNCESACEMSKNLPCGCSGCKKN